MYKADSDYTSNKAQKCKSKTDYTEWQKTRNLKNPHFFDIMYLPTCDMYARLHVDAIDFGKKRKPGIIIQRTGFFIYVCLIMSLIK